MIYVTIFFVLVFVFQTYMLCSIYGKWGDDE